MCGINNSFLGQKFVDLSAIIVRFVPVGRERDGKQKFKFDFFDTLRLCKILL